MAEQQWATLAGGCFWCTEAVFLQLAGVNSVESGYIGGAKPDPTYEEVCSGTTGHAECIEVTFDPQVLPLDKALHIFFATHDPTTLNRQGNDVGTQYRSAIYTTSSQQNDAATRFVQALNEQNLFGVPVVTEVQPLQSYWPAESYHQDYFANNPHQAYCAYVVGPKVHKFLETFSQYAKKD